jgi:hypothetical protein
LLTKSAEYTNPMNKMAINVRTSLIPNVKSVYKYR